MEFAFDIETIPNRALIGSLPDPEVSLGNLKDPDKIREKIANAKQEQIDKMALDPFFGRICSFAAHGDEISMYHTIKEISDTAEIELINKVFELFARTTVSYPKIITWNGFNFDMKYLYFRAAILRVEMPSGVPRLSQLQKKYSTEPHMDLMQVLCGWSGAMKLDRASKGFLGDQKLDHDFSKFIDLIETGKSDEIGIYNLKDVELTYRLYTELKTWLF